jgi:hypothetical protein
MILTVKSLRHPKTRGYEGDIKNFGYAESVVQISLKYFGGRVK